MFLQPVVNADDVAADGHAGVAILDIHLQLAFQRATLDGNDGCQDDEFRAGLELLHLSDDILGGVFLHLLSANGRVGPSDAGIEQAQILVDFRRCANGTSWIARDDLLFDGDGGRYAANVVAFGFVHTAQKLACICRQTLHITSLALGIQCVEGQR